MKNFAAALIAAVLAAPAAAGSFRTIGGGKARANLPFRYFAAAAAGWSHVSPELLSPLPPGLRSAPAPVLHALSVSGITPESFAAAPSEQRRQWLVWAENAAREELGAQAAAFSAAAAAGTDPILFSMLYMLQGPYAAYLSQADTTRVKQAYRRAYQTLSLEDQGRFHEALARVARSLNGYEEPMALPEALAASLPQVPTSLMTARVARLRAYDMERAARFKPAPPPYRRGAEASAKAAALHVWYWAKALAATKAFKPARELLRRIVVHWGQIHRKYVSGREMDKHTLRWSVLETLHRKGDFRGAFGHGVHTETVEAQSPLIFRAAAKKEILEQKITVGRPLVLPGGETIEVQRLELSPMLGISGMSFPQLSASAHLALLYIQLKMAKETGARFLLNTGEGGPQLHLAFLRGDRKAVERFVVDWNVENKGLKRGSWQHAKIAVMVSRLMRQRDALFSEFSPEDLARAHLVAQFGSALNGARGANFRMDYDKLREIAHASGIAMIQYKIKQAAKRGGKVDPLKLTPMVAAFRDVSDVRGLKSPELNPELDTFEGIAELVLATKITARKPVSLKFAVGKVDDAYQFLKTLVEREALPDHLQIEGRGVGFSPGSGNAPPFANSSLPVNEAVLVVDAILRKLGVRDLVVVDATGDSLLPMDGVERLMMGADLVSAARGWMGMGLGCAMVARCDGKDGQCPYGIASRDDSLVGLSLDAREVAPKGYAAALSWRGVFAQALAESGVSDWRTVRRTHGLSSTWARVQNAEGRTVTLDWKFNAAYVKNLLRDLIRGGIMSEDEAVALVLGPR